MPDVPRNLKRVAAPPSLLHPTTTLRSEAMASLRAEVGIEKAFQAETLRLDGAVLCRIGVEHQRQGMPCEDVPFWGEPGRYHVCLSSSSPAVRTATQLHGNDAPRSALESVPTLHPFHNAGLCSVHPPPPPLRHNK